MKAKIEALVQLTKRESDSAYEVEQAFMLGLWWASFPDYILPHIERGVSYNLPEDWKLTWETAPSFLFEFISDTAISWHQCYQDIRSMGWRRIKVNREGGILQYLFEIERAGKPEGYTKATLHLRISISTCKQVQVGTETKQVPVYETVCEDLIEPVNIVIEPAAPDIIDELTSDNPDNPPPTPEELQNLNDVSEKMLTFDDDTPF